ncbi:MAG: PepSY domain-containing protein [Thermodesulfobacteriota bacterium]
MKSILIAIIIAGGAFYTQNALADRDASPEDTARVIEALSAIGCPNVGEVEVKGNYFEADDVICNDGKEYEIYLDQNMNVIRKKLDD